MDKDELTAWALANGWRMISRTIAGDTRCRLAR